jgi:hypothetical protein
MALRGVRLWLAAELDTAWLRVKRALSPSARIAEPTFGPASEPAKVPPDN